MFSIEAQCLECFSYTDWEIIVEDDKAYIVCKCENQMKVGQE